MDGPIHDYQPEEDKIRETFLRNQNLWILRFKNEEILNNLDEVLNQISLALNNPETNPSF
jgi:leucyl-tRNA synthetase